jgi:peptidoglycan/xylan/chitin deacetylase (PgdA/CDA1 family)
MIPSRPRSVWWLARGGARRSDGDGVRILFYHRVSDDHDVLAVTPKRFAEQMAFVADAGLSGVDVAEVSRRLRSGEGLGGVVGLSFDDGYLDVAERAAPVLAEHGFAASVFIATAVTEGRASFTWYERQPPLIPWDRIVELDRSGPLRFEAHTRTHPNLLCVEDATAHTEIAGGKADLERRLGRAVAGFCYPAGLFGPRERRLVAEAGFRFAVSCEPGVNTSATDPLALHRIQVDAHDSLLDFRAKLLGGHDAPPPLRSAYRRRRYATPVRASSRS